MSSEHPKILLADDDPLTQRAIRDALVDMGFDVQGARDGDEGCALLDAPVDESFYELLITDVDMPGCSGEELAHHARERSDHIKLLFTSGCPRPSLVKSIATDSNARFLGKPFLMRQLREAIQALGLACSKNQAA